MLNVDRDIATLRLPRIPSGESFDAVFAGLVKRPEVTELKLDLQGYADCGLLGEARLLNLLAYVRRRGITIQVVTGGKQEDQLAISTLKYRKLFLGSLAGLLLGQFADSIVDSTGKDFRDLVRQLQPQVLDENEGVTGAGSQHGGERLGSAEEVGVPIIDRYAGDELPPREHSITSIESRAALLNELVNLSARSGFALPTKALSAIGTFLYEALENALTHGSQLESNDRVWGTRFFLMRRLRVPTSEEAGTAEATPGLNSYLNCLDSHPISRRLKETGRNAVNLVELTVADAGIGIAPHLSHDVDIHSRPLREEREVFTFAMTKEGTSYRANSGRGLGFPMMLNAIAGAHGLLLIRSGRIGAYRHYLAESAAKDIEIPSRDDLPVAIGTTVSMILVVPQEAPRKGRRRPTRRPTARRKQPA